ncbi:unnamed protein product [Paramecium primaurelia]|uniref:Uncharacterized protein n=1 Tax=Paramecium primaurelia TaxID=5886 RepID=A0A8S1MGU3_PARPR|nr:unnamed protein product [Paramecium primaurelia]
MGCSIQKKSKEKQAISQQHLNLVTQEPQIKLSSPKIDNMTIETPSQSNLRAQRLKNVRDIIMNGYQNPSKIRISGKISSQISQL